ncbi:hypothetical protein [Streptomyces xiaopingdaonensis]|uniref:hypothetical protein n=1 Tax=Streptomyces xiaopingdaonensis TaxID=1565415 RepID=UPI0002EB8D4D|nr:hypothetical protein [Streptomyces xiaopingdaonensis]
MSKNSHPSADALKTGQHAAGQVADALHTAGVVLTPLRGGFPVQERPFVALVGVGAASTARLAEWIWKRA